ncbi:hypothetical protein IH992_24625 [Candidatus Poribacteria bacterium]|nr:hypothetical protein [Candidatus Poribacteria bacterium]
MDLWLLRSFASLPSNAVKGSKPVLERSEGMTGFVILSAAKNLKYNRTIDGCGELKEAYDAGILVKH